MIKIFFVQTVRVKQGCIAHRAISWIFNIGS